MPRWKTLGCVPSPFIEYSAESLHTYVRLAYTPQQSMPRRELSPSSPRRRSSSVQCPLASSRAGALSRQFSGWCPLSPVLGLVPSLSSVLKLALVTGIGELRGWRPIPQNDHHRDRRLIVAIAPLEFIVAVAAVVVASRGRHRRRGRCRSRRLAIAIAVVYHHCTVRIGPQSK